MFTYAVFGLPLIVYAAFGIVVLIFPLLLSVWGKAPPIDRIWATFAFCLIVAHMALKAL